MTRKSSLPHNNAKPRTTSWTGSFVGRRNQEESSQVEEATHSMPDRNAMLLCCLAENPAVARRKTSQFDRFQAALQLHLLREVNQSPLALNSVHYTLEGVSGQPQPQSANSQTCSAPSTHECTASNTTASFQQLQAIVLPLDLRGFPISLSPACIMHVLQHVSGFSPAFAPSMPVLCSPQAFGCGPPSPGPWPHGLHP